MGAGSAGLIVGDFSRLGDRSGAKLTTNDERPRCRIGRNSGTGDGGQVSPFLAEPPTADQRTDERTTLGLMEARVIGSQPFAGEAVGQRRTLHECDR